MDAKEQFQRAAGSIANTYSALEQQIYRLIINVLKDGDYEHVDQSDVVMWQVQQLRKIGQLNQEAVKLMAQADGLSEQAITDMIKFHGMQIVNEVDQELQNLTGSYQNVSDEVNLMMMGIAHQTWTDLQNNVNESLVSRNYQHSAVTKAYRQVLTESTIATVSGYMTHDNAVKSAMYRLVDRGLPTRLTDKAGRNWSIEGYTRMVVNTTVQRTYNEVRLQRMHDFGVNLALMSSHPNSREACAWIQGHVVNLVPPDSPNYNDKYDSIYNHGYGTPAGTQGINCSHVLWPFDPEKNTNHQPQYDPKEAIKNGKLVQQQRARERAIRDAKKRLKVAEELGDQEMISKTKTLISARQKKLREFIKETNDGKPHQILARDYAREQVVRTNISTEKKEFIQHRLQQRSGKQRQHIYGSKEYNERVNKGEHPSYFTISQEELDSLVKEKINFNKLGDRYQYADFNRPVGYYLNKSGTVKGRTSRIKIHQSQKGYHAVPAKSREMLKNEDKTQK